MYSDLRATTGGAWLVVEDDTKISYRIESDGEVADFAFLGPVELAVGMSAQLVRRCGDLFAEAAAEMDRLRAEAAS